MRKIIGILKGLLDKTDIP